MVIGPARSSSESWRVEIETSHDAGVTVVVVFAVVVSVLGVAVWLGLLIWAAMRDGRTQREHEQDLGHDDRTGQ
jgi:hypothetical protein